MLQRESDVNVNGGKALEPLLCPTILQRRKRCVASLSHFLEIVYTLKVAAI